MLAHKRKIITTIMLEVMIMTMMVVKSVKKIIQCLKIERVKIVVP
jgi:hypothetical protein